MSQLKGRKEESLKSIFDLLGEDLSSAKRGMDRSRGGDRRNKESGGRTICDSLGRGRHNKNPNWGAARGYQRLHGREELQLGANTWGRI